MKEFPLLLFDGERESYVGDITIHPTYEFKPFQFMISGRIGVSPKKFSIYLLDRRTTPTPPFSENRRKIPVTGKVNFGFICNQTGCCFLVVMKRRRQNRCLVVEEADDSSAECDRAADGSNNRIEQQPAMQSRMPERLPLQQRHEFMASWQNYLISLSDRSWERRRLNERGFDSLDRRDSRHGSIEAEICDAGRLQNSQPTVLHCSDCSDSDADTTSFHCCVNDTIIHGFYKSIFGPISRPKPDFVPFSLF
ncbi:hypothetical protein M569_04334 [Genlisea aurea]|uniref:DUF7138 domain-containing protein n=1 Tax=Genlisea aurea TaxID=192259 RepID=S8CT42_9LAMI|nr:hypothetical protein M569_04334 [Genlisea aurea]